MKSKAAIGNHPIHPILVTIPIGAFFVTLVGDILHTITPVDPFWYDLSYASLGIGLLFAVVAAVFGAIDYLGVKMSSTAFRLATWHAALNAMGLVLLVATFVARRHHAADTAGRWPITFGLFLIGFGILGFSGWIGGRLTFEHRVGVIEEPPQPGRAASPPRDPDSMSAAS